MRLIHWWSLGRNLVALSALLLAVGLGCSEDEDVLELKVTVAADPAQGTAPLLTTLTATVEGGKAPFTFLWNYGDGVAKKAGSVASHEFTSGGEFPVTVSVQDATGQGANAQVMVTVSATGIPQVGISATATIGVAPMNPTFTATVVGGNAPYAYAWTFCDGTTADTEQVAHEFTTPGACAVQLKVTDANGDMADDAVIVRVASNDVPAVEVTADGYFGIAPFAVNFAATAVGGNAPLAYQWSIDDVPVADGKAPALKATLDGGTHAVKVEVTDVDGSTASDTATIVVSDDTTPDVVLVVEGLTEGECAGVTPLMLHFTCTSTLGNDPKTTIIYFGNGDNVAHWDAWYQYEHPGSFTALCEVRDINGNVSFAEQPIVVAQGQLTAGELATRVTNMVTNMSQKSLTTLQLMLLEQLRYNSDNLKSQFEFLGDLNRFVNQLHAVWQNGMPGQIYRDRVSFEPATLAALTPNVFAETVQFLLGYVFNEASLFDQGPDMATYRVGNWTDAQICQVYERMMILRNLFDINSGDDNYKQEVKSLDQQPQPGDTTPYFRECLMGWMDEGERANHFLERARMLMHMMEVAGVWVTVKTHCDTSVDLVVEVGPDRVPLLNMTLWPEKATGYTEVSQIAKVMNNAAMIADVMGTLPIETPLRIANGLFAGAGKVSFEFMKMAESADAWTMKVAVDEDVSLSGTWENDNLRGVGPMRWEESMLLNVPATAALMTATVDRAANTLQATLDAKGLLELPALTTLRLMQRYKNFYIPPQLPGEALFRFDLKGLQGIFSLDATGMMRLDDVGAVGATSGMYLVVGDEATPLAEIDLNTVLGGTPSLVDYWFGFIDTYERAVMHLAPNAVARLLMDLCKFYDALDIPEQSGVNACECGQTYSVDAAPSTEGGEVTVSFVRYCARQQRPGVIGEGLIEDHDKFVTPKLSDNGYSPEYNVALQMVKGTLTLSTTLLAGRDPIVVEEGQCLMVRPECFPMAAESFLDCLVATECPYYEVTAEFIQTGSPEADHGTAVVTSRPEAECGDTRVMTLTPEAGYMLGELRINPPEEIEEVREFEGPDSLTFDPVTISRIPYCNEDHLPSLPTDDNWPGFDIRVCRMGGDECQTVVITFFNISQNHVVEATFVPLPVVAVVQPEDGTIAPDPIRLGCEPTVVTITPDAGFGLDYATMDPGEEDERIQQEAACNPDAIYLNNSRGADCLHKFMDKQFDLMSYWVHHWDNADFLYASLDLACNETKIIYPPAHYVWNPMDPVLYDLGAVMTETPSSACACRTAEHPAGTWFPGLLPRGTEAVMAVCDGTDTAATMSTACSKSWHVCTVTEYKDYLDLGYVPMPGWTTWGADPQLLEIMASAWAPRMPLDNTPATSQEFMAAMKYGGYMEGFAQIHPDYTVDFRAKGLTMYSDDGGTVLWSNFAQVWGPHVFLLPVAYDPDLPVTVESPRSVMCCVDTVTPPPAAR